MKSFIILNKIINEKMLGTQAIISSNNDNERVAKHQAHSDSQHVGRRLQYADDFSHCRREHQHGDETVGGSRSRLRGFP